MSKVLVDRELLERIVNTNMADYAVIAYQHKEIRGILAQHAEAEGVAKRLSRVIDELKSGFVVCRQCGDQEDTATLDCVPDLEAIAAALSAVTAERDRLQEQCELNDMVHGTKGRERVAALLAKNEVLSKDAARLDWLDGYIVIAEHEDTGKFAFNSIKGALRECVDAAMAAKEG